MCKSVIESVGPLVRGFNIRFEIQGLHFLSKIYCSLRYVRPVEEEHSSRVAYGYSIAQVCGITFQEVRIASWAGEII